MMRHVSKMVWCAVTLLAMTLAADAQTRSGLSGTWVQDAQKTEAFVRASGMKAAGGSASPAGAARPVTLKISQTTAAITFERQGADVGTVTYKLDGTESENRLDGRTTTSRTRWDGQKLQTAGTFVSAREGISSGSFTETRWVDASDVLYVDRVTAYDGMKFMEKSAFVRKRPEER